MTNCIKDIEQLILNAINGLEYQNQLEDILSDYGEEVNHYRLSAQLQILKTKFVDSNEKTVSAVIDYMKNNISVQTNFYSEIIFFFFFNYALCRQQRILYMNDQLLQCVALKTG